MRLNAIQIIRQGLPQPVMQSLQTQGRIPDNRLGNPLAPKKFLWPTPSLFHPVAEQNDGGTRLKLHFLDGVSRYFQ